MLTRSLAILTILLVSTRVCSQEQVDPGPRAIRPPKDFRLFLDCSGSMAGGKAKALKESAKLAVACLDDKCLLTIVAFNSSAKVSPVFSMRKADDRTAAKNWIDQIQTGGGTDYLAALKATALPKGVTSIWISDGAHNGRPEPVEQFVNKHVRSTIYTVAVECAPSSPAENLMTRMAVLSGGSFVRVEKSEELVKTILDIATRIGGKYRSHPPTKDVLSFQGVDGRLIAVGYDGTPTVLSSPNVTKLQRQHFADLPGQKVDLVVTELSQNCNVSIRLDGKRSKDAHLGEIHLSGLPSGEMHVDTKDGRVFAGSQVNVDFTFRDPKTHELIDPRTRSDLKAHVEIHDNRGNTLARVMATPARNTPALQARVNVPNRPGSNLTIHGKTYATTPSGHEFSSSTDRTIAVLRPHKIVAKPEILRVSSKTGAFQSKLELSIPDANDLALRFSASFASKPASLRILSSESKDNTLTIRFEAVRPGTYRGNLVVRADARVPVPALNLPYEFDIKPKYFGLAVTTQALDLKSVKSNSGAIRLATLTIPTPDETPLTYSLTVSDLSNGKAIIPVSADVRTVAPAKGRPAKIVLTVDIPDVPAGLYTARVLFAMRGSAQSGNFEQPFQVTVVDSLTIQPIDFGLLEPGSVRKQSLLISNDGRQDIHNLQLTTSDVAAKGGLVEVTAPTTVPIVKAANQTSVDVQVAVSPLVTSRGDHQGVLEVRRPNGTVSRIPVRLKIVDKGKGRSELIVSPDQVRLTAKPGEVVRFQLSVKLSSDGPDSDKLTLSSTVLTGPDNAPTNTRAEFRSNDGDTISKRSAVRVSGFLVAPDQPATYTAQISITSSRSGNRMIPLTLEVR